MDGSTAATSSVIRKTEDAYTSGRAPEEEAPEAEATDDEPPSLYFSRRSRPVDFKYATQTRVPSHR